MAFDEAVERGRAARAWVNDDATELGEVSLNAYTAGWLARAKVAAEQVGTALRLDGVDIQGGSLCTVGGILYQYVVVDGVPVLMKHNGVEPAPPPPAPYVPKAGDVVSWNDWDKSEFLVKHVGLPTPGLSHIHTIRVSGPMNGAWASFESAEKFTYLRPATPAERRLAGLDPAPDVAALRDKFVEAMAEWWATDKPEVVAKAAALALLDALALKRNP